AAAGAPEPHPSSERDRPRALVDARQLGAVAVGLLQVVAEQLLDLAGALVCDDVLEPGGEALVQVGAHLLRQRVVRRLADEDVAEAEGVLAGEGGPVRTDELLAHERGEAAVDLAAELLVGERLDGAAMEDGAFDRRALDRPPLAGAQLVEARGE